MGRLSEARLKEIELEWDVKSWPVLDELIDAIRERDATIEKLRAVLQSIANQEVWNSVEAARFALETTPEGGRDG